MEAGLVGWGGWVYVLACPGGYDGWLAGRPSSVLGLGSTAAGPDLWRWESGATRLIQATRGLFARSRAAAAAAAREVRLRALPLNSLGEIASFSCS